MLHFTFVNRVVYLPGVDQTNRRKKYYTEYLRHSQMSKMPKSHYNSFVLVYEKGFF
jgi:hypothetical protein